jgi:hypothetical protein
MSALGVVLLNLQAVALGWSVVYWLVVADSAEECWWVAARWAAACW